MAISPTNFHPIASGLLHWAIVHSFGYEVALIGHSMRAERESAAVAAPTPRSPSSSHSRPSSLSHSRLGPPSEPGLDGSRLGAAAARCRNLVGCARTQDNP